MEIPRTWHRIFLWPCLLVGLITLIPRLGGLRLMDDAYMFVRYADHLLEFGDLRWNPDGEPVYGATSVLYVFALLPFRLRALRRRILRCALCLGGRLHLPCGCGWLFDHDPLRTEFLE